MQIADAVSLLLYLNALIVVILLIYEERDPSTTLAWALALMLFPGLGLALYLVFGRNWRLIGIRDRRRVMAETLAAAAMAPLYEHWTKPAQEMLQGKPACVRKINTAITAQNGTLALPCYDLTIIASGADKFSALMSDIAGATSAVHLEYFIWESDRLTEQLCELLERKLAEGVEVRVMYDWVGSWRYDKSQLRRLASSGAHVRPDDARWSKLNYRNHRKIAVIDGRIAYTGGMNLGQEYVDGRPRYESWRDTDVRFQGPLVAELQRMFASRWHRLTGESLFDERHFPALPVPEGKRIVWSQVAHSGAESEWQVLKNAFLLAIMSANERVRIQSPYFVPDESIIEGLVTQSLAGVDVQFMMTGVPDKRIAWNAAFSYIDELLLAGGKVLQYDTGFFHPKTITIDDEIAVIGTTNFDIRSFLLHEELSVFFFDSEIVAVQDKIFDADAGRCHEVTLELLDTFSPLRRFGNAFARLWSRLL